MRPRLLSTLRYLQRRDGESAFHYFSALGSTRSTEALSRSTYFGTPKARDLDNSQPLGKAFRQWPRLSIDRRFSLESSRTSSMILCGNHPPCGRLAARSGRMWQESRTDHRAAAAPTWRGERFVSDTCGTSRSPMIRARAGPTGAGP